MKFAGIRWLFVVGAVGVAFAGVVSSNVGCGSDDAKTGTAGTSGTAGSSGGGSTGTGGSGTTTPKLTYNFDTATASDSTSWKLNDYVDATPAKNLGAYMNGDAGLTLADPPTMEWASDDSESSASSGSMKISVTFDSYGQYVDPVINLPGVVDLSNRTLTMKVRLVSGTFMAWSQGGVQFHFSTTSSYTYSAGTWVSSQELMGGGWKIMNIDSAIAVPANAGAPWDPTMVIQVGVQITAGSAGDAGAPSPGRLVFEIDTFKG
jgi:hypothetical protein